MDRSIWELGGATIPTTAQHSPTMDVVAYLWSPRSVGKVIPGCMAIGVVNWIRYLNRMLGPKSTENEHVQKAVSLVHCSDPSTTGYVTCGRLARSAIRAKEDSIPDQL